MVKNETFCTYILPVNINFEGKIRTSDRVLKQEPKTDEMVAKGTKMG